MVADVELRWGTRSEQVVDGVPVLVEATGPLVPGGNAPTVVALHGFVSGTFTWAGVAPAWAEAHRVVAWDRPPFGRSGRPAPGRGPRDPYRLEAEIERAVAIVGPHVGAAGVVLVGHSAGALLAVQLVVAGVLPVRGVVLVSPALDGAPPAPVRRAATLPGTGFVAIPALRLALLGAGPALRAISHHRSPITDATAIETAKLLRGRGMAAALWHLTSTWRPPAVLAELGPLGVPTMVVGGLDDRISSPPATEAIADRLEAELHLLAGVGHAPHEQVPHVVGPLVGAFVGGIGR
ncbi:MAG: alpha/beta fold hydrolase [Acidimicrobiales bacterium]